MLFSFVKKKILIYILLVHLRIGSVYCILKALVSEHKKTVCTTLSLV